MRDETPPLERPWERCSQFEKGAPRAAPDPKGYQCLGAAGQEAVCPGCVHFARGLRSQAAYFAETIGGGKR